MGLLSPCRSLLLSAARLVLVALCFTACLALVTAPARAQDAPDGGAEKKADPKNQEMPKLIPHIMHSAGPVFGPMLAIMSLVLVTIIVLLSMDLRMSTSIPAYFVEEFTDTVNKRRFKEAFDLAKNENSFLGRVLTAGMGRLQYGIEDAREATMNMVESIKAGKEQLIVYLATLGTLGPLIGLVGTVFGMIQTFMVLAIPGKTPDPSELAKGISHALVVTLLGIGLSVPAIFCHAFYRNRLIRISMDTANIADDLLTQMYHNSKKAADPAAPGAKAPGAPVGSNSTPSTPAIQAAK